MLIDCNECGRRLSDRAKACPQCGAPVPSASLTIDAEIDSQRSSAEALSQQGSKYRYFGTPQPSLQLSDHVRENLKKHAKHTEMTCLECGYAGLMGVKKTNVPWYVSWWMLLVYAIVFAPLSWIFILIFVLARFGSRKHETECPNCGVGLQSKEFVP